MAGDLAHLLDPARAIVAPSSRAEWEGALDGEWRRRLQLLELGNTDAQARRHFLALGQADPVWWVNTWCWTNDPRRIDEGLEPVTPLCLWESFQVRLFRLVLEWVRAAIDKPRDMGVSIIVMAAYLWAWRYLPGARLGVSSLYAKRIIDGAGDRPTFDSLFGKLLIILRELPGWLQPRWKFTRGSAQGSAMLLNLDNGASILGEITSPGCFHSLRLLSAFFDEAAHARDLDAAMTGIGGTTRSIYAVSTPNGPSGYWPRLCEGEGPKIQLLDDGPVKPGHWQRWTLDMRMDPRKDDEWEAEQRASMTEEQFEEQYLVRYRTRRLEGRQWPEFARERHVYLHDDPDVRYSWEAFVDDDGLDDVVYFEIWDPGLYTACIHIAYSPRGHYAVVVDYLCWLHKSYDQMAEDLALAGWYCEPDPELASPEVCALGRRGRRPFRRAIDRAATNRIAGMQTTAAEELAKRGIVAEPIPNDRIAQGNERVRLALRYDALRFSPRCLERLDPERFGPVPTAVESAENYVMRTKGALADHVGDDPEALKDKHSHIADCIRYGVQLIWGEDEAAQLRWSDALKTWIDTAGVDRRKLKKAS